MLISKFDLYKSEWLELVFDDRNKEYGAYDLRKNYAGNLLKAMGIAFFCVTLLLLGHNVFFKSKPTEIVRVIPDIPIVRQVSVKQPVIVHPRVEQPRAHVQLHTIKYPILTVARDQDAINPPKIIELQTAAIGTQTKSGKDEGVAIDIPDNGPMTGGPDLTEDNTPRDMHSIEVMPEPVGGAAAWSRFLQKNIHYPPQAAEVGAQGKVWISFIIEKDGKLSNIMIEKGIGHGLDEEALRVLKLAPAWKPGIQNGAHVRVKYSLPINFMIPESD